MLISSLIFCLCNIKFFATKIFIVIDSRYSKDTSRSQPVRKTFRWHTMTGAHANCKKTSHTVELPFVLNRRVFDRFLTFWRSKKVFKALRFRDLENVLCNMSEEFWRIQGEELDEHLELVLQTMDIHREEEKSLGMVRVTNICTNVWQMGDKALQFLIFFVKTYFLISWSIQKLLVLRILHCAEYFKASIWPFWKPVESSI